MKKEAHDETGAISIQVIERMVSLLDALAMYPDPVSLKELSAATKLHPSTAHRILNDLVVKRFVDRSEPGTYRLGMRLLELGNIVKSRLSVREAALDFMRALHRKTHQTINLSVRQSDEIVYIDRSFSERSEIIFCSLSRMNWSDSAPLRFARTSVTCTPSSLPRAPPVRAR